MDFLSHWQDALGNVFTQLLSRLAQHLPNVLGAFLLLVAGWLVARVLRALATRMGVMVEQGLSRLPGGEAARLPSASARVLGNIIFWMTLLVFLTAAAKVLGLAAFSVWLSKAVDYLPTLAAGGLVILAGFLFSRLVRDIAEAAVGIEERQRRFLGKVAQIGIFGTAILVGADQIGIKVTILIVMASILAAALVGGVALSVSLGAKSYVANLIGGHYLRHAYSIGQRIRVAGFEGRILDLGATSLVLETADGRVNLPARVFHDEAIVLLPEDESDGHA